MKRILRFVTLCALMLISFSAIAGNKGAERANEFDWNPVMEAIIQVESGGNRMAKNGNQVGAMQISPSAVTKCIKILKLRNSSKRYTLADMFSIEKSKEMFVLIQSFHNPTNNVEQAIRAWNGGPRYSVKKTQRYYEKVMRHLKNK